MLGGCRNFNCEYNVDAAVTPTLSAYTYTPEDTLVMTITTPVPSPSSNSPATDTLADQIFTS